MSLLQLPLNPLDQGSNGEKHDSIPQTSPPTEAEEDAQGFCRCWRRVFYVDLKPLRYSQLLLDADGRVTRVVTSTLGGGRRAGGADDPFLRKVF